MKAVAKFETREFASISILAVTLVFNFQFLIPFN